MALKELDLVIVNEASLLKGRTSFHPSSTDRWAILLMACTAEIVLTMTPVL
jgi:hypothetical protein